MNLSEFKGMGSFLVTCGRGLNGFVQEEIQNKFGKLTKIAQLDDGKVVFTIAKDINGIPIDTPKLFQLKLVERLFVVLYLENIEHKIDNFITAENIATVLTTIDWLTTVRQLTLLRKSCVNLAVNLCSNPETCPGNKNLELHQNSKKRKEMDIHINQTGHSNNLNGNSKHLCSKQVRDNSDSFSNKSDCRSSDLCFPIYDDCDITSNEDTCRKLISLQNAEMSSYNCINNSNTKKTASANHIDKGIMNDLKLDKVTFRLSARTSGNYKTSLKANLVTELCCMSLCMQNVNWLFDNHNPLVDLYINVTNNVFFIGASLTRHPLSLRSFIPHIALRSTICSLMVNQLNLPTGGILVDPMCGAATILVEAMSTLQLGHVVGGDTCEYQLQIASCNCTNSVSFCSLVLWDASFIPIRDNFADGVTCDFPFGKKHFGINCKSGKESSLILQVINETHRILKKGSRASFLFTLEQKQYIENNYINGLFHESSFSVSLGVTNAWILVFVKNY